MDYEKIALPYHERSPRGKICVNYTKPLDTQQDLATAYSPGVAGPCREIHKNPDDSFKYTIRGNLVAVISNGTAVLGLGNIGPYAAKPVMEGKAMLFKKFADIDVFDIEVAESDPEAFITCVKALEPTFGGINLEDIKAPECFYIEEKLRSLLSIPVLHDDQHGTAIIAGAAFLNACELTGRRIQDIKMVFSGAGAAAIGCAMLFKKLGVREENLIMCDSIGVVHTDREDLNEYKRRFAQKTKLRTLQEALKGADAFLGVSAADVLTPEMLLSMGKNPIVFALANPNPEIKPELAIKTRSDVIIATGRSDYPNQVNNVLGFPYIFRGALDVRARTINDEMKLAAVHAIAALAKETVPEEVLAVYRTSDRYIFGRDYLIPKPVDQRVLLHVAPAVAKAAMDTGVARVKVNLDDYQEQIERILGPSRRIIRNIRKNLQAAVSKKSAKTLPRVLLCAGDESRVLQAAKQAQDSADVQICLLGNPDAIQKSAYDLGIANLSGIEIIDPHTDSRRVHYAKILYDLRKRRGISKTMADQIIHDHDYFATLMLHQGDVDAMINGVTSNSYRVAVKPIIEVIKAIPGKVLAGVYMLVRDQSTQFFADCTINIDPTAEELAAIAISAAHIAKQYIKEPIRVGMLSFASFGASAHPSAKKVGRAVELIKRNPIDFEIDGEMQVDIALNADLRNKEFPFCGIKGNANVLIFPDLSSANIGYKLLTHLSDTQPTGPILVGLNKPAHVMQRSASVQEIVNMIFISAEQVVKSWK